MVASSDAAPDRGDDRSVSAQDFAFLHEQLVFDHDARPSTSSGDGALFTTRQEYPGVVAFYRDFVESVYELLRGNASVTAIGHISHTRKDWEGGRLFSLQDQVNHKVDFIKQNLQKKKTSLILVGHSIGAYIALETYKRVQHQVAFTVGLYPFLAMNRKSSVQSLLLKITRYRFSIAAISSLVAILGLLPIWATRFLVRKFIGQLWSAGAVEAACSHLPHYNIMRNILYMAMTEFRKLSEGPDWAFIEERTIQLAFLFGIDDHWGPMTLLEEISERAPNVPLTIEREGHTHGFCCTEAGSKWVAHYVARSIKDKIDFMLR